MTWFEDEEWIGSTVSFDEPHLSTWRLVQKIRERENYYDEDSWKNRDMPSEARGIFVCEEEEGQQLSRQAVLKIYMQIPFYGTISKPRSIRSKQAITKIDYKAELEIKALQALTDAKCSSTPSLLAWKHCLQDNERYVPGGYITYILMEKCPGINMESFFQLPRDERDQIRAAFKKAWHECIQCGYVHDDPANRNLIWNKEQQKCYLVDWEDWSKATAMNSEWEDAEYIEWHVAWQGNRSDLDDMSTWEL